MPNLDGESPWGFATLTIEGEITADPTRPLPIREDGGRLISYGSITLDAGAVTVHYPPGGPEIGWIRRNVNGGLTVKTPNGIEITIPPAAIWNAACVVTGQHPDGSGPLVQEEAQEEAQEV